jgi:hypothetical protein
LAAWDCRVLGSQHLCPSSQAIIPMRPASEFLFKERLTWLFVWPEFPGDDFYSVLSVNSECLLFIWGSIRKKLDFIHEIIASIKLGVLENSLLIWERLGKVGNHWHKISLWGKYVYWKLLFLNLYTWGKNDWECDLFRIVMKWWKNCSLVLSIVHSYVLLSHFLHIFWW